jgi:hypothetical protein
MINAFTRHDTGRTVLDGMRQATMNYNSQSFDALQDPIVSLRPGTAGWV